MLQECQQDNREPAQSANAISHTADWMLEEVASVRATAHYPIISSIYITVEIPSSLSFTDSVISKYNNPGAATVGLLAFFL